jgi:hypothetical protein
MTPAEQTSGASPSSKLAPVGNGATAEAAGMFMFAPQARTAVPLQWSRHHRLLHMHGSHVSSGTLPHARGETSEPQFACATFGTVVRECGSRMRELIHQRRISWRVQIRGEEAADRVPAGLSSIAYACRAAENSTRVEVGDLHTDVGRIFSRVRAGCPGRVAIRPRCDRAARRTRPPQAACRDARYSGRNRTSRHCGCNRPHPFISMEFRLAASQDELIRKEVRYGHV